ncbi:hypothetical protein BaRGS_00028361 [Batillaria attramentaria]|uniref:Uncharacterized protein n=1 Tax=Batillaria attramentaria TaxID=370345 RepID=A0ABD0JZG2_9CAEN
MEPLHKPFSNCGLDIKAMTKSAYTASQLCESTAAILRQKASRTASAAVLAGFNSVPHSFLWWPWHFKLLPITSPTLAHVSVGKSHHLSHSQSQLL